MKKAPEHLPGPAGMGAVGMAETSTVGMAETGAEGTVRIGAMGMARAGIPTSAAIPNPSKVSANREIGIQMKGRPQQGATQIHMYEEEVTKEEKKK